MTFRCKRTLICSSLLVGFVALSIWYAWRPSEPMHQGRRLSEWIGAVTALGHLRDIVNGDSPSVRAVQAMGTNAIPWLLREMRKPPPLRWQLNQILEKQPLIKYRFAVSAGAGNVHQLRARCGFWALAHLAEPAIPDLEVMLERQPEFAPSALAGIGAPALEALHNCLTNIPTNLSATDPRVALAESTIGSLYVAISVGRISRADAAFLIPPVQAWARQTNQHRPAFWAKAFLGEFEHKKVETTYE